MRCTFLLALVVFVSPSADAQTRQQSGSPGWPCAGNVDPSYVRIAEATGGSVLMFHPSEVGGSAAELISSDRHRQTILRAAGQVADGLYEYDVPVDSTIESLYLLVSMQCLQVATVVTPSGEPLDVAAPGVEYHHFESIRLFVVTKPAPGLWKVAMGGSGMVSLTVKAKTDLAFGGVTFLQGGIPLGGGSPAGKTLRAEVALSGATRPIGFRFVSPAGASIRGFDLQPDDRADSDGHYAGEVTTPGTDFRVAVVGRDANGFPFLRVDGRLFLAR
jgi:hypothetical protein